MEETLRIFNEAIEKQQRDIDELQACLLALKSGRNASVPVSRLPPEILCRIFSFVQVPELDFMGVEIDPLEWINLAYVCCYWRNIAINAPSLWVKPPITNRRWVEEMLRRSKDSSLVIKLVSYAMGSGMRLALKHIHRIKKLSVRHVGSEGWFILQTEALQKSASRLERLCLVNGGSTIRPDNSLQPILRRVSEDALCNTTGVLRQLELRNCVLNWNAHSHLLYSLTHLKLSQISYTHIITGEEFVDVMRRMPDLEVLDLCNAVPHPRRRAEQQFSRGSEGVHLARLQILSIRGSILEVETFFRHVSFPPTAMVKIVCKDSDGNSDEDSDDEDHATISDCSETILGLARSYSNPSPEAVFQSLILRTGHRVYDTGIRLMFFTDALKDSDMASSSQPIPRLDFVIYCAIGEDAITRIMNVIFTSGMHLDDVTHICFHENISGLMTKTIALTLGQLPRVRSVVVAANGAKSFFNTVHLGLDVFDPAGSGGNAIRWTSSFLCLSSITLYEMAFVKADLLESPTHPNALSMELLVDFLMQRCNLGVPIDKLSLCHCLGVLEKDIKLLEEIVVNVEDRQMSEEEENEGDEENDYSKSGSSSGSYGSS